MGVILSIDVGTTNVKAGVVDTTGTLLASAQERLEIKRPEDRAAEHDPEELFSKICGLSSSVTREFKGEIETVVLSTYQFGLILLDEQRQALTGITTLLDTRARVTFDEFKTEFDSPSIYTRTGCPPFTQYPLARLYYFAKNHPELFARASHILSSKAYLLQRLTGECISDPSTEAASQLMNLNTIDWDEELIDRMGVKREQLAELHDACSCRIPLLQEASERLGVSSSAEIIPGLYDGGALAVGLGGLSEDAGVINVGTSGMLRVLTREPIVDAVERMEIQTYYLMDGLYFAGGAVNNATVPLNWLKDNLTDGEYDDFMEEARTALIGSRKVFFHPFFTGERDWQIGTVASASLFGLREFHTRAEILRSALEGVAYSLNRIRIALSEADVAIKEVTIGGGGVRHPLWGEILANVMNLPMQKVESDIACLVGNGILGFLSDGSHQDLASASTAMVTRGERFEPDAASVAAYEQFYEFYMKLFNGFKELYREHSQLNR